LEKTSALERRGGVEEGEEEKRWEGGKGEKEVVCSDCEREMGRQAVEVLLEVEDGKAARSKFMEEGEWVVK